MTTGRHTPDVAGQQLSKTSRKLLRELHEDPENPALVNPDDELERAAAIELAISGLVRLVSFEQRLWELHLPR